MSIFKKKDNNPFGHWYYHLEMVEINKSVKNVLKIHEISYCKWACHKAKLDSC